MDLGRDNTARIPDAGLLGEARDLWRALNEHVPDLVLQVRPDGTIFFLNRAPNGPQGSVLLGSNVLDLVAPAMREDVRRSLASMTAAGPARRRLIHAELSDGSRRWYATTAVPVARDGHLGAITIAARDILLEQANPATPADSDRHLKQLAMLGLLSGGLIHNFNNLLTVIGSAAAVLLDALPLTDPLRSEVESIRYATTHGTLLTRQLLRLARRQPVQRARVELNAAVQEVAQLSQLLLGPNVSLVLQLEPLGAPVHIEQGEMEQVLLNLLLNARDAMPGGGRIVVSTARLRYSETSAPAGCVAP